ncbi:SAM-dependent methyltransferase [Rhodococcus sp. NPDC058505]|uniref:SAM-dependent methyltransferase n=1 Tax=unclassified Rhodococcus (in: high G+C Gram-positive bacteria) TaxID=192944 RepID=UPI00364D20F7
MPPRPAPFETVTTPEFWNDPHISGRMLVNHLDPDTAAASRPHAFVDRSVDWLIGALGLVPGTRVLDVGCGPGLYAHRLARRGIEVLGVDVSATSVAYARGVAEAEGLAARFVRGDYFTADLGSGHDAALLIYEDYCALSPDRRVELLRRIRAALADGGRLLFDVTAAPRFPTFREGLARQQNLMDGFWAEPPYLGTLETHVYPDLLLALERYTIESAAGTRQFWNWTHCLTPEQVTTEVAAAGLRVTGIHGDVAGSDYDAEADAFAVVADRG